MAWTLSCDVGKNMGTSAVVTVLFLDMHISNLAQVCVMEWDIWRASGTCIICCPLFLRCRTGNGGVYRRVLQVIAASLLSCGRYGSCRKTEFSSSLSIPRKQWKVSVEKSISCSKAWLCLLLHSACRRGNSINVNNTLSRFQWASARNKHCSL